ncbi:hypothetical protein NEIRO03_2247 [Nematocida sp. AWRm78]|nr:hypothetical protein NEIRO02_2229 [Nematocida sp. AWRm79]KAI5186290.1 hypothetical protein NEIRO03_2247 [Nematocida sp. AWRm78]
MTFNNSSQHRRGKKQLEAGIDPASHSPIEPKEVNSQGSNCELILRRFENMTFTGGREALDQYLLATISRYPQAWQSLSPFDKTSILTEELARRSGSIEVTMATSLRSLLATAGQIPTHEWTEGIWTSAWARVLELSEVYRDSPVAELPCFRDVPQNMEHDSYTEWGYLCIAQTIYPARISYADILLEFNRRQMLYPPSIPAAWRMGEGDIEKAQYHLMDECVRLDRIYGRKPRWANKHLKKEKKEKINPSSTNRHQRFNSTCHKCGKRGHRARECRSEIQSGPRSNEFQNKPKPSRQGWTNNKEKPADNVRLVQQNHSISRRNGGLKATVQGVEMTVLCDTGADLNLMSWSDYKMLQYRTGALSAYPTYLKVGTAGPSKLVCKNFTEADVTLGDRVVKKVKIYIGEGFRGTLILGNPTLQELGLRLVQQPAVNYTASHVKASENVIRNIDEILENENPEQIEQTSQESLMSQEDRVRLKVEVDQIQQKYQVETAEINTPHGRYASEFRFMPNHKLAIAKELVLALIKEGFMEETQASKWLIPIRLARKPNGTWRFCLDLKRLNDLVEQDNYPLPDAQWIFDGLYGKKIFSVLDIANGFFRVPLREEDRQKTTCKIGNRCYRMKVLPMGYKNSPAIFQRIMDQMLRDELETEKVRVYIDDILIATEDYAEHLEIVSRVLRILKEHGMQINWDKVKLAYKEIKFLGHTMWMNKVKPIDDRIKEVLKIPVPATPKQVRSFLGKINYMGRHIYNLSELKAPLNEFTNKGRKFEWKPKHQEAFENLKAAVGKIIAATMPDPNKRFTLETDASNTGVGAVLRQEDDIIGFFSMRLTPTQQRYTITERELYAIVWAMGRCKQYLLGVEFDVITDHKAIEAFFTKKDREFGNERIQRWMQALEGFNFTPKYRRGEEMIIPDGLSRMYEGTSDTLVAPSEVKCERLADKAQHSNPKEAGTFDVLRRPSHEGSEELRMENSEHQSMQDARGAWEGEILKHHEDLGHRKMIRDELSQKGIMVSPKNLARILKKCRTCLERDNQFLKHNHYIDTSEPGELIGIDLMEYHKKYIFVAIDYYSRKAFTFELRRKEAKGIVDCLTAVLGAFPFRKIICDNGKEFVNTHVKEWLRTRGIEVVYRPPYFHEGTGRVERLIRTLRDSLNRTKGSLRQKLNRVTRAYNQTVHRAVGTSPERALLPESRRIVEMAIDKYKKEFSAEADPPLSVGTTVLVRNDIRQKDDKHFERSGRIARTAGPHSYEVILDNGARLLRNRSQLKVCNLEIEDRPIEEEIGNPLQEWLDHYYDDD